MAGIKMKNKITKRYSSQVKKANKQTKLTKAVKGAGQKGQSKGGKLPNPFEKKVNGKWESSEFSKLSTEEMMVAYDKARKRVNTQFNKLVREGIAEYSEAYVGTRDAQEFVGKNRNVGFSKKFRESMYKGTKRKIPVMSEKKYRSLLTEEYKKIYLLQQESSSLYVTAKDIQGKRTSYEIDHDMESKLARLGINPEDLWMEENIDAYKEYWDYYTELRKAGLVGEGSAFGLSSDEAQDIVMNYYLQNKNRYIDIDRIISEIKSDVEKVKAMGGDDIQDEIMYSHYFENETDFDKLSFEAQKLAKMLAKEHYGTKPETPSFEGGFGNLASMIAQKFGK